MFRKIKGLKKTIEEIRKKQGEQEAKERKKARRE